MSLDPSHVGEIQLLDPQETADWDAKIAALPEAGIFHSSAWSRVLRDAYGYRVTNFCLPAGTGWRATLPVVVMNSWLTGRREVSLPFADAVEPLAPDAATFQSLYAAALSHAKQHKCRFFECRGGKQWLPDAPASTSFLAHRLDLTLGEAELFKRCDESVQRALRKAGRTELKVEFTRDLADLRAFYRLLGITRKRHGVPPQPFAFFAAIHRHILAPGHGSLVLAKQGSAVIAGGVFFHFGRNALYKFGASDPTHQHLRANNLVMWEAIRHYASAGFHRFDFGRTSIDNEGLQRFKLGWGSQESRLDYTRFECATGRFVTAPDRSAGWHSAIFKNLPIFVSRLIGSALYRHLG